MERRSQERRDIRDGISACRAGERGRLRRRRRPHKLHTASSPSVAVVKPSGLSFHSCSVPAQSHVDQLILASIASLSPRTVVIPLTRRAGDKTRDRWPDPADGEGGFARVTFSWKRRGSLNQGAMPLMPFLPSSSPVNHQKPCGTVLAPPGGST